MANEVIIEDDKFSWFDLAKAIWFFLDKYRARYVFLFVSLFAVYFYEFLPPYLVGKIIDFLIRYEAGQSLTIVWIYLGIIAIGGSFIVVVRYIVKYHFGNLRVESSYFAKVKGFERLMNFSVKWHDKENSGNKIGRIERGAQGIDMLHQTISRTGIYHLTSLSGVIIIFGFLEPRFVIFFVVYLFVFFFIQWAFYRKISRLVNELNISREQASGTYYEGVGNLLTIKTLGVKDSFRNKIDDKELSAKKLSFKMRYWATLKWTSFNVFEAFALAVFVYLLIDGALGGLITIGSVFVYFTYIRQLSASAKQSTELFDTLVEHKSGVERMMPIFKETEPVYHGTEDFPQEWNHIAMVGGSFSYKQQEENQDHDFDLKNIGLVIKKNEKIGIVGKSGSGKSTLAKIMLGLYKLDKGEFLIGESSFYDIDNTKLTEHMTTVMQDSEMFNMTLRDNISLMRKLDPVLLRRAIKVSKLEEVIAKLPQGLDTLIGEKGYRLSGGERQRVGIARAIYKDPEILVLDEATSSLDSKTEAEIQHGLEEELTKKTMIIIAHRVSTLSNVETIYVFDEGKIVEQGSYDELLKNKKSKFYEISQVQNRANE